MRSLYNKILALCLKKQSEKVLYFISFIESSVFPIPIVFLMIPVQLVKRHRAMIIGFLVTVTSVLGGALGYYLGYFFYDTIGAKVISLYGYQDSFLEFTNSITKEMEFWFVFFYAFTPFPYKLLTISSILFILLFLVNTICLFKYVLLICALGTPLMCTIFPTPCTRFTSLTSRIGLIVNHHL